jgi:hypothetical protein
MRATRIEDSAQRNLASFGEFRLFWLNTTILLHVLRDDKHRVPPWCSPTSGNRFALISRSTRRSAKVRSCSSIFNSICPAGPDGDHDHHPSRRQSCLGASRLRETALCSYLSSFRSSGTARGYARVRSLGSIGGRPEGRVASKRKSRCPLLAALSIGIASRSLARTARIFRIVSSASAIVFASIA